MGKAIILSRVSTLQQHLESQTADLYKDAAYKGYTTENIILIEDKESAIKLSEEERNGLNLMKDAIENDNVDCVFVWEITRISRQLPMLYSIRDYLQKHKVQLYCHQPQFILFNDDWSISDVSNMVFAMFAVLAENEMKTKKARMMRARLNNVANGKSGGGRPPFGYTTNKEKYYIINENEAAIVRRIFNDYASGGISIRKICANLQAEGYFPKHSYTSLVKLVNYWINREYYTGNDKFPPIITKDVWEKTRKAIKANTYAKTSKSNIHLLKGMLYDKNTGYLLSRNSASDIYQSRRLGGVAINRPDLDRLVWDYAADLYYTLAANPLVLVDKIQNELNLLITKMTVAKENIDSIQEKIDKVEERIIYGKISEERANDIINELSKEKSRYKQAHHNYFGQTLVLQQQIQEVMFDKKSIRGTETIEQKLDIVHKVIKRVEITRVSRGVAEVTIYNNYNDNVNIYHIYGWRHIYEFISSHKG